MTTRDFFKLLFGGLVFPWSVAKAATKVEYQEEIFPERGDSLCGLIVSEGGMDKFEIMRLMPQWFMYQGYEIQNYLANKYLGRNLDTGDEKILVLDWFHEDGWGHLRFYRQTSDTRWKHRK